MHDVEQAGSIYFKITFIVNVKGHLMAANAAKGAKR